MGENTQDDAVNALIADSVSRRGSTSRKRSSSSPKNSKSSGTSSKASGKSDSEPQENPPSDEPPAPDHCAGNDADTRLAQFMAGERPMIMADGTEHFYNPAGRRTYTLQEISDIMGVTRERVRQIEQSAIKKMFAFLCTVARKEGQNPLEWASELLGEIESRKGYYDDNLIY